MNTIASVTVDCHWEACDTCLFYFCEEKQTSCIRGVDDEYHHAIDGSIDDEYLTCSYYTKGEPINAEEEIKKAKERGVIFDHKNQTFLVKGIAPYTEEQYLKDLKKSILEREGYNV